MNKFHECVSNRHGDWTMGGKQYFLPISVLLDYIKTSNTTIESVPLKKIAWKGMHTANTDEYDQRYHDCDISFPGVVVEDGDNPYDYKYRMIDGCHRIRKIMTETSKTHSDFYVLKNEEFIRLLETYETERWENDEHLELVEVKDYFGFPACVYRFKKHDDLKSELLKEVNNNLYTNQSYVRRKPESKPLLWDETNTALSEIKIAYEKAYDHFYNEILACDLSLNHPEKGYETDCQSKPIITQSWVVSVPPNPTNTFVGNPMSMHMHFLSPVCGAYYLNLEGDTTKDGGNLVFLNPSYNDSPTDGSMMYMIRHGIRAGGMIKKTVVHPLEEGDIVLWAGILKHTIEPFYNTKTNRVSIITNSCVTPLSDVMKKYNYNISPFYKE